LSAAYYYQSFGDLGVASKSDVFKPVPYFLHHFRPLFAMSDSKNKSAYGVAASDTDFRKNWDLDEYAAKAKEREAKEKEEGKARYEAKLAGKKYHKPMTGNETYTSARRNIIDVSAQIGKTQLVPAGAGVGKRGRGAGFYCEACDLTFKDNLQWVEVCIP
jgi:U4/U6.U5 tri-snRNP component SNU23